MRNEERGEKMGKGGGSTKAGKKERIENNGEGKVKRKKGK